MVNDSNDRVRAFRRAIVFTAVCASGMVACGTPDFSEREPSPIGTPSGQTGNQSETQGGVTPLGDVTLLTRVEIDPTASHVLEFYEYSPGDVVIIESMASLHAGASPRIARAGDDPLETFARARPGEPVPAELVAAVARSRAIAPAERAVVEESGPHSGGGHPAAEPPTPSSTQSSGDVGRIQQAHSSSSITDFINTHGMANVTQSSSASAVKHQDVKVQWGGGYWCQMTDDQSRLDVDHYSGNGVTVRRSVNGVVTDTTHAVGTTAAYISNSQGFANRRWDILNASGDSFHVRCMFLRFD